MNQNTLLLLPIKNLHGKEFIIEKYQRGYKWGKKEILELLNDINEYEPSKGVYCIQPIILKPLNVLNKEDITIEDLTYTIYNENEVIDGQQRTTSIYLILEYLRYLGLVDEKIKYSINYKIRDKSGAFLSEQIRGLFEDLSTDIIEKLAEKNYKDLSEVQTFWSNYILKNEGKGYDNVDIYHFFTASYYIKNWFKQYIGENHEQRKSFVDKLINHIHFIWYSLDDSIESKDVVNVFLNNNKGKISLTTSELIKALFILDISNKESKAIAEYKINRFALEWDMIEKKLQDDTFWYFIQPDKEKYNKGTRIDFLFDLKFERKNKDDDSFSYRKYEQLFNELKNDREGSFESKWSDIIQLYNKLIDWYNEPFTYNYIGYLTATKILNLQGILSLSVGRRKQEFKQDLKDCIKTEFAKTIRKDNKQILPYHIDNLHYKDFYRQSQNVILLYNVLYHVERMAQNKFPFELYVKEKWSIEHIIPQTPKDIDDFVEYKLWFEDQIKYKNPENEITSEEKDILEKLKKINGFEDLKIDIELQDRVNKLAESFENKTHLISNLLLLDRNTNSALSNHRFLDKRTKILEFDRHGKNDENERVFIPMETLNAFNKTFSENLELKQWSNEDGQDYKDAIEARLEYFLPKN
ncbi:DUF262 domain-containing protein [Kaistella flava (ex Peng et al. 2021)]|uniref:DUF262 domain-containing protein n=1 Tax=Kaistella flava (ex Peng et al. 2021) TaxID=2038776 RepID=A0A7M2Y523_9FLAO|nr:DUF262 domain-containing protein [Kaistella flava (ex Peng et al. 2021)]QOW09196.1 DUF262 domain-containing protein [Kaistella flava (ex Peng et al. 2021)]